MEVASSRDGQKPIGYSAAERAAAVRDAERAAVVRDVEEICRKEQDKYDGNGALELLGVELFRACKENSDQQQDIGELLDKRVAATGFDPRSMATMMMRLAVKVDKADVVAFCLGQGAVVDHYHLVVVANELSFASHRKMIEAKAVDINSFAGWHGHILSVAVANNNFAWAQFCLENGARPNISKVEGYKLVIAYAAEGGFQATVELLLSFGARLRGSGAIVLAAGTGQTEMVRWLLAKGADVNEVGVRGPYNGSKEDVGTPLHRAIANGHKETAKLLIENGANLALPDMLGRTPTMLGKQHRPDWLFIERVTSQGAAVPGMGAMG